MRISKVFNNEKIKVYVYTAVQIVTMVLAFVISILLTRWLNPAAYGKYKYAVNILLTLPVYFAFGIHFCASRIIAEDNADESHGIVPVSLGILSALSLIVTAGLYLFVALPANSATSLINEKLNDVRIIFPFVVFFASKNLVTQVYHGTGKIYRLSLFSFIQNALMLLLLFIGKRYIPSLTFEYCVGAYIVVNVIIQIPVLSRVRIKPHTFGKNARRLFEDVRTFGLKLYFSSIATSGVTALIGLISASVYGYEEYGYYTLALSMAQFFTFISSSMAVVQFRENVNRDYLKRNDLLFMVLLNAGIYLFFNLIIGKAFHWFFPIEYGKSLPYLRILALSFIFNGMATYFNRFFIARKMGKAIMMNSFRTAGVSVMASVVLIPNYKISGLVAAALVASTFDFVQYVLVYRKYRR